MRVTAARSCAGARRLVSKPTVLTSGPSWTLKTPLGTIRMHIPVARQILVHNLRLQTVVRGNQQTAVEQCHLEVTSTFYARH